MFSQMSVILSRGPGVPMVWGGAGSWSVCRPKVLGVGSRSRSQVHGLGSGSTCEGQV